MQSNQKYSIESPEVVIVEASAGTGKTYELARRYIQLLINFSNKEKIPIQNILAITFTNRATLEMKERILDLLKKIALGSLSSDEKSSLFPFLNMNKKTIKDKANKIMDELIKHYSLFQVQTIDSLINTILLSSALKIERSASFRIMKEYNEHLAYSLDIVVEKANNDKNILKVFEDFIEHYLFIENRTSWFPKQDVFNLMKFLFSLDNHHSYTLNIRNISNAEILKTKSELYNAIKNLSYNLPKGMNERAKKNILKFIEPENKYFDIERIPSIFKNTYPPMNKGRTCSNYVIREWEKINKKICRLAELEAYKSFAAYIELFFMVLKELHRISQREDILFLEELNKKTYLLFKKEMSIPELYYRMSMRFSHYLIDEFQDTSLLQWLNLKPMIEDALSSGGTLFYVGDKKQAIYRFRGGEAKLFDEIRKEFKHFNPKLRLLRKNWRSQKAIVEFNNYIFSERNLRRALLNIDFLKSNPSLVDKVLRVFKDSKEEYLSKNIYGYVRIEKIDGVDSKEIEEITHAKLISLLSELHKRLFAYRDIAILCRNNNELEKVTAWLLENNIPVESEKTLSIVENPLIKEIISFLKFLNNPIDDVSFASFILGEIFRKKAGLSLNETMEFIFNLNKEKSPIGFSLYHVFRNKYSSIWKENIEMFFKNVGFISLYELIISIYTHFNIMENFNKEQAFFMKLIELVKEKEDEYLGLEDFLSYLSSAPKDDLYVTITETNSIHVLTIHKAKGLEFDVVILPFLGIEIIPQYGNRKSNCFLNIYNNKLELIRITKKYKMYSKKLQNIYKDAYINSLIDELNTIYVAFTRPRLELYIFLPHKIGNMYNKAKYFIENKKYEWGKPRLYKRKEKRHMIKYLSPSKYQDWIKFLKDEVVHKEELLNRDRIIYGNIIHLVLSYIGDISGTNMKLAVKNAIEKTKCIYPSIKIHYLEKQIMRVLNEEKVRPFFFLKGGRVYTEKEIVTKSGQTRRIDRLIIKKKEMWIIDYKVSYSSIKDDEKQMKEYMEILNEFYKKYKIRGFLLYLDIIKVKEIV